jgi:beta-phosphoglucomutase
LKLWRSTILKCILFDFDGVIADTEPIHLAMFQKVLAEEGIALSKKAYLRDYLGYDDAMCFTQVYRDKGQKLNTAKRADLIKRKSRYLKAFVKTKKVLLPGAKRVIKILAKTYPLGIVSGALKSEIKLILKANELGTYFKFIIAAEDVKRGKPHPEGYKKGLAQMKKVFRKENLKPSECLVIEDSHWGIQAAHAAGMQCLAVATSYPQSKLNEADWVVSGTGAIDCKDIFLELKGRS